MSLEEIINIVFGGRVDASQIVSILVAIYAVVMSIVEFKAKKKLIKSEIQSNETTKELKTLRQENKRLEECVSKLSDVMLTAYLSSNTVPMETKKQLGAIGNEINSIARVNLNETTNKLISAVTEIIPSETLNEHKQEVIEATRTVEEIIDKTADAAQKAINKIKLG